MRIRQINVGQGDAILIMTPDGKRILIDAGPNATQVANLLRRARIDTLDLVIASHNHADHIGGMPAVLRQTVVRAYLESGIVHTSDAYRRTMRAVENEPDLQYLRASDRTISVGSVKLRIFPPPYRDDSHNNNSVGVLLQYGKFDAVFTGDSEHEELAHWLKVAKPPKVELVKAAHHGSADGTTAAWVKATSPSVVLISVGAKNGYRHPSARTMRMWESAKARVYRTDRDGTIEVMARADGYFTIQTRVK